MAPWRLEDRADDEAVRGGDRPNAEGCGGGCEWGRGDGAAGVWGSPMTFEDGPIANAVSCVLAFSMGRVVQISTLIRLQSAR